MSTRSGGSKGSGGASTVRESASRRYSTPKGAEKAPTLSANGKRVGRPPASAATSQASARGMIASAREMQRAEHIPSEADLRARHNWDLEHHGVTSMPTRETFASEIARYRRGDVSEPRTSLERAKGENPLEFYQRLARTAAQHSAWEHALGFRP